MFVPNKRFRMTCLRPLFLMVLSLGFLAAGCDTRTDYEKLVDRELASGKIQDSLFLGMYFDMRADSFYTHCFNLNKQQVIKEGMGNTAVQYEPEELDKKVKMYFYPKFNQETEGIREMPMLFTHKSWAPWNPEYSADSLLPVVRELFMKWYGGGEFLEVTHPTKGAVWVKVDGNRQIRVFPKDIQFVRAIVTDLSQKQGKES